ncbi:hypothetical protein [Paenibacillus daejeonensis]|uniref:hypothetical protein n=1 Tax=Paenibacillus daejeonensis TaxID=135193 RepID=UPI00037BADE3|nr:hypothetical protein [Paenibacillus daejeonensis]
MILRLEEGGIVLSRISVAILALGLLVIVGFSLGSSSPGDTPVATRSLEEEMYFVDLIVRGTVVDQEGPFNRNAGLPEKVNFTYDVTPSIVAIEEVIYGELDEAAITFLQHGTAKTSPETSYLETHEEVVLLLNKTEDNYYWSYMYEDGIWRVQNGIVQSKPNNPNGFLNTDSIMSTLQNQDVDVFVKNIRRAAENRKRPEF